MQAVQLSLLNLAPQNGGIPIVFSSSDPMKANRLQQMADKMQKAIDAKKNSAIGQQRPTARRARIAQRIYEEGLMLEQIQSWLYALANEADRGTLPNILNQVTTKAQLEIFLILSKDSWTDEDIKKVFTSPNYDDWRKSLSKAGIHSFVQAFDAIAALKQLHSCPQPDPSGLQIRQLEQDLLGRNLQSYFPTPKAIVQQMILLADIRPSQKVLEPSAGKGDIAQKILAAANGEHPTFAR